MTEPRIHRIGHRRLVAVNVEMTEEAESVRQAQLRHEFIKAVPSAGRLEGSELMTIRKHTHQGADLHFSLVERPGSATLPLDGLNRPDPTGADLFQRDVERVIVECKNIAHRLTLASSPLLSAAQVRGEEPVQGVDVTLRRLFGRRARKVSLPSPSGDREIELPPQPRHMPEAEVVVISAVVADLPPKHAVLESAYAVANAQGTLWDAHERVLKLPASLKAKRKGALPADDLLTMVSCMDAHRRVRMKVKISFAWATGSVSVVEILSVLPPETPASRPRGRRAP